MTLIDDAERLLAGGPICDACLGRAFARLGHGLANQERGRALRVAVAMALGQTPRAIEGCEVCDGLFERLAPWVERAVDRARTLEFATFLVGCRLPEARTLAEQERWGRDGVPAGRAEPLRQAVNRAFGIAFSRAVDRPGIDVSHADPELRLLVDLAAETLEVEANPLFLYGRYCKLERGIPQTRWPCRACRGAGCDDCDRSGQQYPESVQSLIGDPLRDAAGASEHAFHGAGREDIDALMLGDGRPFVIELVQPKRRALDLETLTAQINAGGRVAVRDLQRVARRVVKELKALRADKRYRARVATGADVEPAALAAALPRLIGEIQQRTPVRVSHRRADLVRQRSVRELTGEVISPRELLLEVEGEAGLYIKELVTGDSGRTSPSLAGVLGCTAQVTALDVLAVRGGL